MNNFLTTIFSKRKQLLFRKFSRKNYAAFCSMHKVVHISRLAVTYSIIVSPVHVFAQSDSAYFSKVINIEEVEISGQKEKPAFDEMPRIISIVTSKEIECAPAQNISDLLRYTANIDIRQRGKSGIQSDISIRGGSFDQSMVLFNGVNITDPQTGHLSLFLPVDKETIDKIEILNGPSARIYGSNAFSGAVNFITKPLDINSVSASVIMGDFGYINNYIKVNFVTQKTRSLLYFNNSQADGYKPNTDYKKFSLFYQQLLFVPSGLIDFQLGYAKRAFGANSYYTPAYPDQYEANQMIFSSLSYSSGKKLKFNPKIYWRRHYDRFELFREDSKWYTLKNDSAFSNDTNRTFYINKPYKHHNHHINDVFGSEVKFEFKSVIGKTQFGVHLRSENIYSSIIGYDRGIVFQVKNYPNVHYNKSDSRTNFDIYLNHNIEYERLRISAGLLVNWNSYMPNEMNIFPGADLNFIIIDHVLAIGSYNYTLGIPTFTDLTYEDANNTGNNELVPYKQHSLEGGLKTIHKGISSSAIYFNNFGSDIIDWVWVDSLNKYKALNIPSINAQGIELTATIDFNQIIGINFPIQSLRLNYTYIDMDKNISGKFTKYSNVKNMFSSMVQVKIIKGLFLASNLSWLSRAGSYFTYNKDIKQYDAHNFNPYCLIDVKLSYTIKYLTIYTECTNVTNQQYIDAGSLNQPGRWLSGGIKIEFSDIKIY